jgi:tetratricopeptide (TPR) repeat protein
MIAALLLSLIGAGSLAWQSRRQTTAARPTAADSALLGDEREARLLRAVTERPADARAWEELTAYYLEGDRPFEALWELDSARESGTNDAAVMLRMSEALRRAGQPAAAIRLLTEARRRDPGGRSLALALAQTYLEMAEPEAALAALRRGPGLRDSADALLAQARAHFALGNMPAARTAMRRCRDLSSPLPSLALGRLALAMGDGAAAREDLAAAAASSPGDEAAQYHAGLAFAAGGAAADRLKAIEYFKQATRADPRSARAGVALGRLLYEEAGQGERAAEIYRRALQMDSRCREAEEGLARVLTALQQPEQAVYHQARVFELTERPEEALHLYRRWGELQPERWDSVLRAAECLMDMQRYLEAAREVQRGLERYPNHPELYSHLAQLYIRTDSRPEAARLCDRWAPLDATSGRPEWVRGQLAFKALRFDEAVGWFEAATRKNPEMGVYHAELGATLARDPSPDRLRQARAALERAAGLDPTTALPHYQLALVLQQLGDAEGARQSFLRALNADSERLDAYRGLMAVARRLGRSETASFFAELERAIRDRQREEAAARRNLSREPRDARRRLVLVRLLLRRGDLTGARNHLVLAAEQPDGAAARPLLQRVRRLLDVR